MITNSHQRKRIAIKRSVHFVLTDAFANSLVGVAKTFTKEFWHYLDNKSSVTRKNLRNNTWSVWIDNGIDILSTNFTQSTLLVLDKERTSIRLNLKETAGELTQIRNVPFKEPLGEDPKTQENDKIFEGIWKNLIYSGGSYPSEYRPITAAVAQMISARTQAPLPVVCAGIKKKFAPSNLSNGFSVMAEDTMPDEVFDESLVSSAIKDGIAERVGESKDFTFKVKKNNYREWISRVEARSWDPIERKSKNEEAEEEQD